MPGPDLKGMASAHHLCQPHPCRLAVFVSLGDAGPSLCGPTLGSGWWESREALEEWVPSSGEARCLPLVAGIRTQYLPP